MYIGIEVSKLSKIIEVEKISKSFTSQKAIDDVSFSVIRGEIFGFLGPSGSGKTTTINVLMGQVVPETGRVTVLGKDIRKLKPEDFGEIGLVSDDSGFYEKMTMYDNLKLYSKLNNRSIFEVDELLRKVGIYENRTTIAQKLSTGMKQRMLLVRSLINHPKLIFLDEPTSGLDPVTSRTIHQLILSLKEEGMTIFLTTHDMHEATLLCDNLVLLNKGKLIEQGSPLGLIRKYNRERTVKITYSDFFSSIIPIEKMTQITNFDKIVSIHSCEPTLEDIFIKLTGGTLNA